MQRLTRRDALECGFRLAHQAATGREVLDAESQQVLEHLGVRSTSAMASSGEDRRLAALEEHAQKVALELRPLVAWLIAGYYTVFLLSRDESVVRDAPLPGTLKNAFSHMVDAQREWLATARLPGRDVDRITKLIEVGPVASPQQKASIVTDTLRLLREDAMRQDSQETEQSMPIPRSPWFSGSFYLVSALTLLAFLAVVAKLVPIYSLPLVLIGGVMLVITVGLLQLRNDDRLRDHSFAQLLGQVLRSLPLLRKGKR